MTPYAPPIAWRATQNGFVTHLEQSWVEVTGQTADEALGLAWQSSFHPDDRGEVLRVLEAACAEQRSFAVECRIFCQGGDWRWFVMTGAPDAHANQGDVQYRGTFVDISTYKTALAAELPGSQGHAPLTDLQQALRESEARFRVLVEATAQAVWETDALGELVTDSPSWRAYTGQTLEESLGYGWVDAVHPEDREYAERQWREAVAQQNNFDAEFRLRHNHGGWRWTNVRAAPLHNDDGTIAKWVGMNIDITARKQAEEALRASERQQHELASSLEVERNRLAGVLEHLPAGVWIVNPDGRLVAKNRAADRIWAGDAPLVPVDQYGEYRAWDAQSGKRLLPDDYPAAKAVATGQPAGPVELNIRRLDGTLGTILVTVVPVSNQQGMAIGFVGVNVDITERKQAEEAEREQRVFAEALADVAQALNRTLQLDEVLDLILRHVGGVVPADVAEIMLFDDGIGRVVRSRGYEDDLADELMARAFSIMDTPNLACLVDGDEPLVVPDLDQYAGWIRVFEAKGLRSYVGAPIRVRGDTIGCLSLLSTEPGFFTETHGRRLQAFADQAANAIHNAHMFTEAQEAAVLLERHRLARDLHDAVSQVLFAATTLAEALPRVWERKPSKAREGLEQVVALNRAAMAEMRMLLLTLRPEVAADTPMKTLLSQLIDAAKGRKRIEGSLTIRGDADALPVDVRVALYRIAQESVNNVLKHSRATRFAITLIARPNAAELSVEDNGQGFDVAEVHGGLGLHSMEERAASIGGRLHVTSQAGRGSRVSVVWKSDGRTVGS